MTYDRMVQIWGFDFSGHTGYTTDNQVQYSNYSLSSGSNICGSNSSLDQSPIIYNETD